MLLIPLTKNTTAMALAAASAIPVSGLKSVVSDEEDIAFCLPSTGQNLCTRLEILIIARERERERE